MPANGWLRRLRAGCSAHRTGGAPLPDAASRWAAVSERLTTLRIAVVVHAAAAALGLGLVAGLYLRGLVCRTTLGPRGLTWARMSDPLPLVAELETA